MLKDRDLKAISKYRNKRGVSQIHLSDGVILSSWVSVEDTLNYLSELEIFTKGRDLNEEILNEIKDVDWNQYDIVLGFIYETPITQRLTCEGQPMSPLFRRLDNLNYMVIKKISKGEKIYLVDIGNSEESFFEYYTKEELVLFYSSITTKII